MLAAWLEELDLAHDEGRLPLTFELVTKAIEAGSDLELAQRSPIVKIWTADDRPVVGLADGRSYTWYGSWSRNY
ncbi:hypothetical protein ABC270_13340 [Curtobacterium sp. 1P10AnD]|uniref:hypothetical protein n=1 Tax=Curtobacterium sp. 1P10AnD TaxID=3132283 RepID=UPI0039A34634